MGGAACRLGLQCATDDAIFRWAQKDGSIVITFDEDFADERMYPAGSHAGVVRLRVWPTTIEETEAALRRLLGSVAEEDLQGSLVIVDPAKIRVGDQRDTDSPWSCLAERGA